MKLHCWGAESNVYEYEWPANLDCLQDAHATKIDFVMEDKLKSIVSCQFHYSNRVVSPQCPLVRLSQDEVETRSLKLNQKKKPVKSIYVVKTQKDLIGSIELYDQDGESIDRQYFYHENDRPKSRVSLNLGPDEELIGFYANCEIP